MIGGICLGLAIGSLISNTARIVSAL